MEYLNLKAEMARYSVSTSDISASLGISEKSVRNKISGISEFTWSQAKQIQQRFFKGFNKDYLFARETDVEESA